MSNLRVLAFDTSLSSPGVALIELKNGKPKILAVSHVKTSTEHSHAVRAQTVYAWAHLFVKQHEKKGFDVILREDFQGRSSQQNHPVFAAWSACERALADFGLSFTIKPIGQAQMKKLVCGKGSAEKHEIEQSVREITGYTGEFAANDESDAVALGLAYIIREGLITK